MVSDTDWARVCTEVWTWLTGKPVVDMAWPCYWNGRFGEKGLFIASYRNDGRVPNAESWPVYLSDLGRHTPVPRYHDDDSASAQLLDEMAGRGYSVHQWATPMGTHVTIEPWTNTDEFPGYAGGYLADVHDPDRKRAIADAALEASKEANDEYA